MVHETDEPGLGSADAQLIDPRVLMALEDYAASAVDAQLPDHPQSNISVTVNGRPIPLEAIESRDPLAGQSMPNERE